VEEGEEPGAGDGEQRHRLGEAVDRGAPRLVQQQQDGGDQRAGMADPDPPDEVDDGEAPRHGDIDAPNPNAGGEEIGDGVEQQHHQGERQPEAEEPTPRRSAGEHDGADLVGDGGIGLSMGEDGRLRTTGRHGAILHRIDLAPVGSRRGPLIRPARVHLGSCAYAYEPWR